MTAERQARRLAILDFPTPVGRGHAAQGPAELQRAQPADASRPRRRRCARRTHQLTSPPPSPGSRSSTRAPSARSRAARRAEGAPLPRVPRPRGARPLGGALVQARPRRQDAAPPGRAAHQHRRAAVRPGLRGPDRAGLPRRRQGHRRAAGTCSGSTPTSTCSRPSRCGTGSGTSSTPSGLAAALSILVFEARRPDDAISPAAARRADQARPGRDGPAVGRARRAREGAQARLPARAGPRLRVGGVPLGRGRRPRLRARPSPTSRPATSCAG